MSFVENLTLTMTMTSERVKERGSKERRDVLGACFERTLFIITTTVQQKQEINVREIAGDLVADEAQQKGPCGQQI